MYNKKNVDYAYLLWEDFVYQVENKNVKKSNEMYYPRFTKVIVNFFMTKDQSIPRRNSVNWYYARDDYMFTMIKELYLQKMQVKSDTSKTPPTVKGKRLKTSAKADKPAKKKQPTKTSKAKGLTILSEVALTEDEQLKLATKRSLIQTHISHVSGSGADEETSSIPGVPNVPTYDSDDEQISWKSSEEDNEDEVNDDDNNDDDDNDDDVDKDINDDDVDNQDDANQDDADDDDGQTNSDNDGDDFVHPKLSTHDDEARKDDEVNEEESNEESDDERNEESDEEVQGVNTKREEMDEESTHESRTNELYRDVNVNLEGRDTVMTDAPLPKCINSIFTLNTEATSLVDVPVTTIAEPPLVSATTLPLPPTPLITHMQQTPVPTPTTVSSSSLQNIPNFGSLFGFDHRLKTLETDFSKFKQTNQFAEAVSTILTILPQQAEVMTRSSTESKTSLAIAANLSKLELKKILIDKMERNKSIHRSDEQKNLYKALVEAYECDKLILDTYELESTSTPKEKTPKSTGKSTEGSKSLHKSAGESAHAEEPMHTTKDLEELAHQEFKTGATKDQHLKN
ncbi:hypothetical protein Tco_1166566 [Tanacetum coccineum]